MNGVDLLPCPFCNARASIVGPNVGLQVYVVCAECGSRGAVVVGGHGGSKAEAIAAWNRRALPSTAGEPVAQAARDLIASRSSTFRAGNNRQVGVQDESGEKMWIVPFDEMAALEQAIANLDEATMMTEDQIKHMVDRFLQWKLPEHFNPDGGISFDPIRNPGSQYEERRKPVGTNLFDATQVREMVLYMLDGLPPPAAANPRVAEGWVMVPVEPTVNMVTAGAAERDRAGGGGSMFKVYSAMLKAAPQPPLPPSPITGRDEVIEALRPFAEAYRKNNDPGISDLDNEQSVSWHVTLGDYRRAAAAIRNLKDPRS